MVSNKKSFILSVRDYNITLVDYHFGLNGWHNYDILCTFKIEAKLITITTKIGVKFDNQFMNSLCHWYYFQGVRKIIISFQKLQVSHLCQNVNKIKWRKIQKIRR